MCFIMFCQEHDKKCLCLKCNSLYWFDSVQVCLQYLTTILRPPKFEIYIFLLSVLAKYFKKSNLLQWFSACVCENKHRNFQDVLYNHELLSTVSHMYTKISSHQSFQIFMQLNNGELECPPSAFPCCSECTRKHWFRPWWLKQSFPAIPPTAPHHDISTCENKDTQVLKTFLLHNIMVYAAPSSQNWWKKSY